MRSILAILLTSLAARSLAGQTTLNLSRDLVQLGIASQNMVPDSPTLDAQPLLMAALQYIQGNPVQLLTADPGAYYFMTPLSVNPAVYVYFPPLSNLTVDFQGSTLYFKDGRKRGFDIELCQGLTLKNFTIDYLAPPYTQVQITAVDPVQRTFNYAVMPGWADPASFTVTPEFGTPELLASFFRNGQLIPGLGLAILNYPIVGGTLSIEASDAPPWLQSDALSTLQPGDVIAVADDIGAEPIDVSKCDSMLLANIEIHGGIGAINLFDTSNTTLDHIRVVPRPGALLGSASGGLMFFDPLRNDHIRNSYVTRTLDDALGLGGDAVAAVVSKPGARQLVVQHAGTDHIPNGTLVNFVPQSTAVELGGGIVIAQDPPDGPDVVGQVQATLTFDRDLPSLSAGDQLFYASPDMRGTGSSIEDNIVEDLPYGRGVYIASVDGVVVERNVIRGTSNAGINIDQVSAASGGNGGPSHGVTIQSNSVENVLGPQASGSGGIIVSAAAIMVSSKDNNFNFVAQPANSAISILNNFVSGSGRAGIWVGEVDGGDISGNVIVNWNRHPELGVDGVNPFPADFAQPLVVRFSQDVTTSNNVTQASSTLQGPVTLTPSSASASSSGQTGAIAVQSNVPNFAWSARSDSDWITISGDSSGTGNGSLQYGVAPNAAGSARIGSITVAGVVFTVSQAGSPATGPGTLNLSRDLVRLGIASQNMVPNTPTVDAQPLLAAAVQFAQSNGVHMVIADPGAYYFLTSQNDFIYLFFANLSDLTIDFQGSTLFFKYGLLRSIELDESQRVTLKNFTIDSLVPRFTQVQLTSVDPVKGTLSYTVPAGWADPASFTTSALGTPQLFAFFFRNGFQVPATAITFIAYPVTSPTLVITNNGEPWTQPDVLSTLRPGDMVAVWDRSGLEAISVDNGDFITLSNIEIHGSGGGFAVSLGRSSNSTADNVRIKPRPGALIASNADGIHFPGSLRNNNIRNCYVTRTTDDAIAMDSLYIAAVASQPGPRQLVLTRNFSMRVSNGSMVNFVPLATAAELSGAVIVSQDPPDSPDVPFGSQMTVTFDRDLPTLAAGDEMVYAAADMRGSGSSIEDNLIENVPGRIYIGGLENVVVERNVIRGASNSAINVSEVTVPAGGGGMPSHGITIQNNSIEHVLGPQASGAGGAYVNQAAIVVSSNDENFDFVPQPLNTDISILNNYIADSGRGGIWVGELNGGVVSNNVIVRWNEYPNLAVWGTAPFPQDFGQPLVVRFSQNVNTAGNVTQSSSAFEGPVSFSPSSASVGADGSTNSFTVQANVPNFAWVATSDSAWLSVTGNPSSGGNGTVAYSLAPNNTGSSRTGSITIAGVSFTVTQTASPTAPAFPAAGVTNAASYAGGTISPGEIVTIFGSNLGPATLAGPMLDSNGLVSTQIGNTQVLFDGVPAPMVYAWANQTSAIVPYEVQGSTQVVVSYNGQTSAPVTLLVAPSVPALFTANSSGQGPGAFLNSDESLNSPANPAAKGSIVVLYATGEGATSSPGVDGKLAVPPYAVPLLPVTVTIDGIAAEVEYKGGAPGEVAGVMQINVKVPASAHSGNLPVLLTVGNAKSQDQVTLAVE